MTDTEQEYFQICAWRYLHPLPKTEYGEVHHVLPKSCGGPNRKWNLVRLTAKEHYCCHELLPEIFKGIGTKEEYRKMLFAWNIMSGHALRKQIDAERFEVLRKEYAKAKSESLKGHAPFKKKRKLTPAQLRRKRINQAKRMTKIRMAKEEAKVKARCVYCGCMDHHD